MDKSLLECIQPNEVIAVIPARSGSKGITNKNIYPLCGYPLIAYSVVAARLSSKISRVIVSTDSNEYAAIAQKYGAEAPFLRPTEIAGDKARDIDFVEHLIEWLYENEEKLPEYIVHLRPTNPLRIPAIIDDAVCVIESDNSATSLRSAHRALHTPYKWFKRTNDEKYYCSIIDGLSNDEINNPRQGFPDVFEPDGYVDVLKTEYIIKSGLMHGDKMIAFETPNGFDIDTKEDMLYLEYYLQKHPHELLKFLMENYSEHKEIGGGL